MPTKNLLVVDDSATTRMLVSLTLKKSGEYRIVEAADGNEAVAKLASEPVDMVLTDLNMPGMGGLDLIAHIRNELGKADLPIVVITTKGQESDRDRGLAMGANAYLTKPISASALQGIVRELLEARETAGA